MNKIVCLLLIASLFSCTKRRDDVSILPVVNPSDTIPPQNSLTQINKVYGGSFGELAYCVAATLDGGYVMAGITNSDDGDVNGWRTGGDEVWIVKVDKTGKIIWQKMLGGSGFDRAHSIIATSDGGYIFAGYTASYDGNVVGKHKGDDAWIVKLDQKGGIQWQKTLGGAGDERANSIIATSDGNYLVAGYTTSNDGDVSGGHGKEDAWIIKLDKNGMKLWQKALGGSKEDFAASVVETADGSYVMAGNTRSNDGDVSGIHGVGHADAWIVKLDRNGNKLWQKVLGGSDDDNASSIKATPDGGYVVAGGTYSNDGDVSGNRHAGNDAWVVKLDKEGKIQWQQILGGSSWDYAASVTLAKDGGYVMAGSSDSNNGDVSGSHGTWDAWIVKLNKDGNKQWSKLFGGSDSDYANFIITTPDGSYLMAGYTASNNGDISGTHGVGVHFGWTDADAWLMTLKDQ